MKGTYEEDDADVRRDEVLNVPLALEENGEAAGEGDDDGADEADPGSVRLEGGLPGERVATDALNLASTCKRRDR